MIPVCMNEPHWFARKILVSVVKFESFIAKEKIKDIYNDLINDLNSIFNGALETTISTANKLETLFSMYITLAPFIKQSDNPCLGAGHR